MKQRKAFLVFSGFNYRAVFAFLRFSLQNKIKFYIVTIPNDYVDLTEYRNYIIYSRNSTKLELETFEHIRRKILYNSNETVFILPSAEFLNRFLLDNKEYLIALGYSIPLCSKNLYELISDKENFYHLCLKFDIRTPKTLESLDSKNLPFVIKPKRYFKKTGTVNIKPLLIHSQEDLKKIPNDISLDEIQIQEYIYGDSFYLLFYFGENGKYSVYSQQNFIQQYNGGSIIAAKSSDYHLRTSLTDKFKNLFQSINYKGLVMVEIRKNHDGEYMIEANPRLWGPSQLILDSKMDLWHNYLSSLGFELEGTIPTKNDYIVGKHYFWNGGIIENLKEGIYPSFFGYDEKSFFAEYNLWLQSEVYLREDTKEIFIKENTNYG